MARYRGPRLRIIRRLGELPGLTQKICTRNFPPGNMVQKQINWKSKNKRITICSSFKRKAKITV